MYMYAKFIDKLGSVPSTDNIIMNSSIDLKYAHLNSCLHGII